MIIKLHLVSHKSFLLDKFVKKLLEVTNLNRESVKVVSLPIKRRVFTVLKSPFVNKKARDQFGIDTYRKLVILEKIDLLVFSQFLKRISCKGVAFKITLKGVVQFGRTVVSKTEGCGFKSRLP